MQRVSINDDAAAAAASAAAAARRCWCRGNPKIAVLVVTLALFVDSFAYGVIVPYNVVFMRQYALTESELGVLLGCYAFAMAPLNPVAGVLSDRVGRNLPFTFGMVVLAGGCVLFMLANSVAMLVAARVLQGLAGAFTWSVGLSIIGDAYPPESRSAGTAMGIGMAGFAIGSFAGPPVSGFLLEYVGYMAPFLFCCGLLAIDLVMRVTLVPMRCGPAREARPAGAPAESQALLRHSADIEDAASYAAARAASKYSTPQSPMAVVRESEERGEGGDADDAPRLSLCAQIKALLRLPLVVNLIIMNFGTAFSMSSLEVLFPVWSAANLHASEGAIGAFFGIFSIAFGLFNALGGLLSDKVGRGPLLCGGLFAFGCVVVSLSFVTDTYQAGGVAAVLGVLAGIGSAPALPLMSEAAASAKVGGGLAFGVWNLVYGLGMAIGPTVGGILSEHVGFFYGTVFLASLICSAVVPISVLLFLRYRRMRRVVEAKLTVTTLL